jgi:polysaccharide biosynthesis transport protein
MDLEKLLRVLAQRWLLILVCICLTAGAALAFSLTQTTQYTTSADLLFRDAGLDQKLFGSTALPPSTDPAREAATNLKLVSLEAISARTSRALGGRPTANEIANKVNVTQQGQADVASVEATDPNPRFAARLANTFAEQYIQFRRDADRSKIADAQALVQRQLRQLGPGDQGGAQERSLRSQAEELSILASLQTGNAELVQRAKVPSAPSSPKTARNVVVGVLLGLLLGVGLALLFDRFDRRIRDSRTLEEVYGLPILAEVPESDALHERTTSPGRLPFADAEAFRMLRARLRYFNVDRDISSLVVTSAAPGEGKSTVAWNLAAAAATTGSTKVLLIEADLRRPASARQHHLAQTPGLSELITQGHNVRDVVQRVPLDTPANGDEAASNLDLIVAGAVPPNPVELMESRSFADLLKELSASYDLVVIDTPPVGVISDAIPLMRLVDGVRVVSELGRAATGPAAHLRQHLASLQAPVLGIVANRVTRRAAQEYYLYDYDAEESTRPGRAGAKRSSRS